MIGSYWEGCTDYWSQICATLRQQQRMCRLIALTVRHSDHVEQTAQETLVHGTYWEVDLQPVLTRLFYRCFRRRVRLTHLRLQVGRLEPPAQQLSLFDESESCHPAFDFLTSVSCYRNGLVIFTSDKEALMAWATESRQDLYVELTPGPAMHDALLLSRHIDISNHGSFYSTFAYVSEARRMPLHAPSRYQTAIPLLKNGLMKSRRSAFWLAATL